MAGILDYLDWRGDVPFRLARYNEVDELVLCRLAYLPFEGVVSADLAARPQPLCDAVRRVRALVSPGGDGRPLLLPGDGPLLQKLENCHRFAGIRLVGYVNRLDPSQEKQFSAITLLLPDATVLVAYRGTDGTLVGWKEDFNMSFADFVPAQREAVAYLTQVARRFRLLPLRVCGHSKGGNLAVFAAAFCPEAVQKRIRTVRNNDGPGFSDKVLRAPQYRRILPRIRTCLPQSSVFGMLLEHAEAYAVVKSTNAGLAQHDLFSWEVGPTGLVYVEQLSSQSQRLDATLKQWMASMTPAQRAQVVDSMFDILHESKVEDVDDLLSGRKNLVIARTMLRRDEPTRRLLQAALQMLKLTARQAVPHRHAKADGAPAQTASATRAPGGVGRVPTRQHPPAPATPGAATKAPSPCGTKIPAVTPAACKAVTPFGKTKEGLPGGGDKAVPPVVDKADTVAGEPAAPDLLAGPKG